MIYINVLSLFDGISCGQMALKRAGIEVYKYYASEIDKNAIKITQANFPETIHIGDVNSIDLDFIKKLPKIDLILAGSPCQGFSRAGRGLNFDDSRSKLFFKFVEVLELIRNHNNPNVKFLLENVKMKKEWENLITDYVKVEPIEINSKLVSAQNRPRVYWSNIDFEMPKDKDVKLLDVLENDVEGNYIDQQGIKICSSFSENSRNLVSVVNGEIRIAQAVKIGYALAQNGDGINISFPTSKSRRGRVIKQKSSTLDCSCEIGVLVNNIIRRLTITELERLQTLPDNYTKVEGISESARKKAIGNGWTVDVIAYILSFIK